MYRLTLDLGNPPDLSEPWYIVTTWRHTCLPAPAVEICPSGSAYVPLHWPRLDLLLSRISWEWIYWLKLIVALLILSRRMSGWYNQWGQARFLLHPFSFIRRCVVLPTGSVFTSVIKFTEPYSVRMCLTVCISSFNSSFVRSVSPLSRQWYSAFFCSRTPRCNFSSTLYPQSCWCTIQVIHSL
jgi:hypothetical protein